LSTVHNAIILKGQFHAILKAFLWVHCIDHTFLPHTASYSFLFKGFFIQILFFFNIRVEPECQAPNFGYATSRCLLRAPLRIHTGGLFESWRVVLLLNNLAWHYHRPPAYKLRGEGFKMRADVILSGATVAGR
jgi:hypothetical protein